MPVSSCCEGDFWQVSAISNDEAEGFKKIKVGCAKMDLYLTYVCTLSRLLLPKLAIAQVGLVERSVLFCLLNRAKQITNVSQSLRAPAYIEYLFIQI